MNELMTTMPHVIRTMAMVTIMTILMTMMKRMAMVTSLYLIHLSYFFISIYNVMAMVKYSCKAEGTEGN